ncbi:MAG: hypothetical protein RIR70_42 [Pseudomonadota bacterium]
MPSAISYCGRFAPTPSGPLHFGSLVAALASALDAARAGGQWLLRIEDVDTPRVVSGAGDMILRELERLGFAWSGPVMWQSARKEAYQAAFDTLVMRGLIYPCGCSRKEMADSALATDGSRRYPGTCRAGLPSGKTARAWRLRLPPGVVGFDDRIQGRIEEDVSADGGDFVVLRADGVFAYQLAVVVDDAAQGVTDVVRGADLLASTLRQRLVQQALGVPAPRYAHVPVVLDESGDKLSKQTLAAPLSEMPASEALCAALRFLGQAVPPDMAAATVEEIWAFARAVWDADKVPHSRGIVFSPRCALG